MCTYRDTEDFIAAYNPSGTIYVYQASYIKEEIIHEP